MNIKVVALAGGVGGAKLAEGLAQILPPENLTIIVNTGDDFEHLGLRICPDLDTVCYTLAGMANPATGWGLAGETWNALEGVGVLGGPSWFRIGDRDMGTHLERTRRLRAGQTLSQITRDFCRAWGVQPTVLPMSNDLVPTIVQTDEGDLAFQEYFVHRQCHPHVRGFRFEGVQLAVPATGVIEAIQAANLIVICPSNPWVSVDPILSIPGVRELVEASENVLAVSPIIAGQAVKGPAAKMYAELGVEPSALAVARHYGGLLEGFIFDKKDMDSVDAVCALGIRPFVTDTLMKTPADRCQLAGDLLRFYEELRKERKK